MQRRTFLGILASICWAPAALKAKLQGRFLHNFGGRNVFIGAETMGDPLLVSFGDLPEPKLPPSFNVVVGCDYDTGEAHTLKYDNYNNEWVEV